VVQFVVGSNSPIAQATRNEAWLRSGIWRRSKHGAWKVPLNALFYRVSKPFNGTIFRDHGPVKHATTPPKVLGDAKAKEMLAELLLNDLGRARVLPPMAD